MQTPTFTPDPERAARLREIMAEIRSIITPAYDELQAEMEAANAEPAQ